MEAVVKIGGKQYRLSQGDRVTVDRLTAPVGDEVTFDEVLLLTDGATSTVGKPTVEGASVIAKVVSRPRGPKIVVFKYKAKKRYRVTHGARADLSLLEVLSVSAPGGKAKAKAAKPESDTAEKEA